MPTFVPGQVGAGGGGLGNIPILGPLFSLLGLGGGRPEGYGQIPSDLIDKGPFPTYVGPEGPIPTDPRSGLTQDMIDAIFGYGNPEGTTLDPTTGLPSWALAKFKEIGGTDPNTGLLTLDFRNWLNSLGGVVPALTTILGRGGDASATQPSSPSGGAAGTTPTEGSAQPITEQPPGGPTLGGPLDEGKKPWWEDWLLYGPALASIGLGGLGTGGVIDLGQNRPVFSTDVWGTPTPTETTPTPTPTPTETGPPGEPTYTGGSLPGDINPGWSFDWTPVPETGPTIGGPGDVGPQPGWSISFPDLAGMFGAPSVGPISQILNFTEQAKKPNAVDALSALGNLIGAARPSETNIPPSWPMLPALPAVQSMFPLPSQYRR